MTWYAVKIYRIISASLQFNKEGKYFLRLGNKSIILFCKILKYNYNEDEWSITFLRNCINIECKKWAHGYVAFFRNMLLHQEYFWARNIAFFKKFSLH